MKNVNSKSGIPPEVQMRYDELIARRRAESLSPGEHSELLDLSEQVEEFEAQRIEYLPELARLRRVSLVEFMADLGIRTPDYI